MTRMTTDEFAALAREKLPFTELLGNPTIEQIGSGTARIRMSHSDDFLRPGGTVSGPVLMGLADMAMYAVVLSLIGPVELAVTTSLNINFLRRPGPLDVIAEARILKLGKRLAVGEVALYSDGEDGMVAHVTATYSIPPDHTVRI